MREIQIESGSRTEVIVCRFSPADLALLDAKLKEAGVRNRSEALRNVIRNTTGMAMPDAELAEALLSMKGALNKAGNNVVQIAKRMNEANNRGQPVTFAQRDLMEVRHLARFVLDFADQADLMARGRSATLDLQISDGLRRMAERGV